MARVAFCQDTLIEYMGFMQMAAVLTDAGHTVEVFFDDQMNPDKFVAELAEFRPDVVGFSVLTPSRPWAIETAARVKRATSALTVCGNVDVILNPEVYVPSGAFDLICIGEGEFALGELCTAIDAGADFTHIAGFWVCRDGAVTKNAPQEHLVDMAALPLIDRRIYDKYRFFLRSPYLRVYAGRGCPFRCSFCANTTMTDTFGGGKKYWRKRSPQQFVEDIEQLIAQRPNRIKRIFIIDEVLWLDRKWLREFLVLYRDRIGLPFSMNFKFNGGITESDIELMGQAGAEVYVATETGDEELRRGLLNKPVTNKHILEVTGWMHRYGVPFGSSEFFGLPGQTFEGHRSELAFFRKVRPKYLWSTFFQPYPGVSLSEHPDIAGALPSEHEFGVTLHNEMPLDLPDRTRLVNMKKVYFLMYRFPRLEKPLAWLCRYRLPIVFEALFAVHFLWYALWAEGCSWYQLAHHLKNFAINPALRKIQPLNTSGRPYDIGYEDSAPQTAAPSLAAPVASDNAQPVELSEGRRVSIPVAAANSSE